MATINITLEGSKVILNGENFEGTACDVIAEVARELGITIEEKKKPEYYKSASKKNVVTNKG